MSDSPKAWVALNADVVGYSALVADDLEATSAAMSDYRNIVEEQVASSGGQVANFVGDSFMAIFRDAMSALRAAIAIATAAEIRNADLPESRRVRFRMGMDQGEVTFADGNHHGDALNIATRIQAIARPGGLAVSQRVFRALDEPALRFRPMGPQHLKNIPEMIGVYEFVDLPSDGSHAASRQSLSLEAPTLAVLPIHTEMADDQVRTIANMMRQDLLHRLSTLPELKVIDAPAEPSGSSKASATYMVETGVHQLGTSVRVYAVLYEMATMNVIKSHKWMRETSEMLQLSDVLAEEVSRSVEVELVVGEPARFYAELDDPEAIEKVYLGWYHLRNDTKAGWTRALDLFGQVSRSHPDHPYGHVLAAFAHWLGAVNRWTPDTEATLEHALEGARKGAALGDPTGMAQAVEAAVLMLRGEVEKAIEMLDGLVAVRPTCDITFGLEGSLRRYMGQWQRAVELLDTAMGLTGINKPWYPTVKACSLFIGGKLDEAASLAEGVLEHQPNNLEALAVLAASQMEMGLERRAHATSELIKARFPSVDIKEWLQGSPYQGRELVDRWMGDLESAGAIAAS